ncbi:hypothetical protein K443DRAFT_678077 [Laccaria amethystina LaAM-08-1]|uniref:Uncharacterized protein n=1 Tax=Laccaria amethystina LaAM-08-1 TaxID=1095629 RepID=A0A0C9XJW6_9AGAR|nr:hypothetical protein K443DRAFT_678077 [Laccaria amethystina LaAM-08-1]
MAFQLEMLLPKGLKRLRLPSTAGRSPVHFTTSSTHRSMSLDAYLTYLQQKGFLDRQ